MPQAYGIAYRSGLSGITADGSQKQLLVDQYGALQCRSEFLQWPEQGSYFRALASATPGTGVAQAVTTGFSATAVPLVMVNGSSTVRVIPHYIRLVNTATGASTTSSLAALSIDSANRYSSGGTDLTGLIVNSNSALGPASAVSVLRFGTVTASAAGAGTRYFANASLKVQAAACWVVGDEVLFTFGDPAMAGPAGALNGAAPISITKNFGPVVLGGQNSSLILHLWNVANATTAPSWALEMAWWER
jgi:hypothetical protein